MVRLGRQELVYMANLMRNAILIAFCDPNAESLTSSLPHRTAPRPAPIASHPRQAIIPSPTITIPAPTVHDVGRGAEEADASCTDTLNAGRQKPCLPGAPR